MKKKVLLVEDDETLAKALSLRLQSMGYSVFRADSVASGMSLLVRRQPDVTLIDIFLPDQSGFSMASQIQSNPNSPKTPVIFMTASVDPALPKKARRFSPIAYLRKPFDASALIDAIEFSPYANQNYKAQCKSGRN